MTFGPYAIDELYRRLFPQKWRKRIIFKPRTRRKIEVLLIIFGIFFAGFFAWQGEYKEFESYKTSQASIKSEEFQRFKNELEEMRAENKERLLKRWQALTPDQVDLWVNQLSPFNLNFCPIFFVNDDSEALIESIAVVFKKGTGCKIGPVMQAGVHEGIFFKASPNESAAPVLLGLLKKIDPQAYWDKDERRLGKITLYIGKKSQLYRLLHKPLSAAEES